MNEIPVFIYHDVEVESFTADLQFLAANRYRTLTTEEFVGAMRGGCQDRCVLLTFDDARRNFFDVAFPLLQQYGVKATLFAPTYWVQSGSDAAGQASGNASLQNLFMTWEELRGCKQSGLVDVQSHAHRHALIYTSERLVGFASPALLKSQHLYDWPMRWDGQVDVLGPPPIGTPIYGAHPLLSAPYRILEDPELTRICQERVAREGGEAFFSRADCSARLRTTYRDTRRRSHGAKRLEGKRFEELAASEFLFTQRLFESELGGKARYLAYPWMLGSALSLKLATEAGIKAVFGVGLDFRRARRMNRPLPAFGRIKGEWLRFLPGCGRARLGEVVPGKIKGFLRNQHLAH
jgi:peptidoglycan/xylan/chitin deacetylase (PgdA/CDA1 family)